MDREVGFSRHFEIELNARILIVTQLPLQLADSFNCEIVLFLHSLRKYDQNVNEISSITLRMLTDAIVNIGKIAEKPKSVASEPSADAITSHFDDSKFDVERTITCRSCRVSLL